MENDVPEGAVLSPLLFNVMFPSLPSPTKTLLYADDITIYATTPCPADAEEILQPALNKIYSWSRKWKFKFAPDKSVIVVFTRSYKSGADPLLFMNRHRIPSQPIFKFLGVWFDQKLQWKAHIDHVHKQCLNLNECSPS